LRRSGEFGEAFAGGVEGFFLLAEAEADVAVAEFGAGEEAGAGDAGEADVVDEMLDEGGVVGEAEGGDIRHGVIGPAGGEAAEAGFGEIAFELAAAPIVVVAEFVVVCVGGLEGFDSCVLERRGGADGKEIVDFADAVREVGAGEDPADTPAGDGVGFRAAVDEDGAVSHAGQGHDGDVFGAVIEDMFVDLVGDAEGFVLLTEFGDEGEFVEREDAAGGVVGRVDDDGLGLRGEGAAEFVGVEGPIGGVEGDEFAGGAAELEVGVIVFVVGLEDDDFVTGVDESEEDGGHAFGGAADDGDLAGGVDIEAVVMAGFVGDRLAEGRDAPGDGVLIVVGFDGARGGGFEPSGGREIGEALREVDGAGGNGLAGHIANDGLGELCGTGATIARPGGNTHLSTVTRRDVWRKARGALGFG
jgi:hypothetical protein